MTEYYVRIPVTAVLEVMVEADNEKEAIESALENSDLDLKQIVEWDVHRKIVQGFVFYGVQNEIEVEEV